ncbi:MAG: hypothetical protein M1822_004001 [Bathelium mastoideum]|nr:MAG: hypothetical protein M1822_004001 [Bathelium mastoideum]
MDRETTYDQLLSWIKLDSLPTEIVVVDESYPADCISFRTLVEPNQIQYKVKGYGETTSKKLPESSEAPSTLSSLQAKPKKEIRATPERRNSSPPVGRKYSHSPEVVNRSEGDQLKAESIKTASKELKGVPGAHRRDSFDEIIQEAKELENLPLDEEDEDSDSPEDDETDSEDSEPPERPAKKLKQVENSSWQMNFQCMKPNDGKGDDANPNARTIEILEQMGRYYDRMQDHWRTLAYRRAVTSLKREKRKITTKEQAVLLPFIGERLAAKIEEIVWTNRLRRLENAQLDPTDIVLQHFLQIYGVGFAQASRWVHQGYTTLDDILRHVHLTDKQRLGIAHYDDFAARIPRVEITQHGDIVRTALRALDPDFEVILGGSYRRGAATCGDIDCIITHPRHSLSTIRTIVVDTLVPKLFAQGFLKATLAATTSTSHTGSKWHGASSLPPTGIQLIGGRRKEMVKEEPWRRIDLLLVPPEEKGAALIYFTGNDVFNRSIRLLASKHGMRLNQHGLFKDVMRGPGRVKVTEGTLAEGRDERKIFDILGMPWREPEERIC